MAGTLVIPALPFIGKDLELNSSESSWIFIGYEVMLIVGSVVYGKLAQSFKLRTLFYVSIVLTTLGGLLALFSTNLIFLVIARMIQGASLSAPIPLAMIIINQYFPKKERKKALAYIALAITLGTGISPVIGGVVTSIFGWKSIFVIISSMIVLLPYVKSIPNNKIEKTPFSFLAVSLLIASFLFVLYGIHGNSMFLYFSVVTWVLFFFVNKKKATLIDLKVLKNKTVITISVLNLLLMIIINSLFFLTPVFLEDLNGLSSIEIGMILLPGAFLSIVSMKLIGKVASKVGFSVMLPSSIVVLFVGVGILFMSIGHSAIATSIAFLFIYVGFGTFNSELTNFTSVQLSSTIMAEGIGISTLFFFTGATFGPAIMGIFLDENLSISNQILTISTYQLAISGMIGILCVMFFIVRRAIKVSHYSQTIKQSEIEVS